MVSFVVTGDNNQTITGVKTLLKQKGTHVKHMLEVSEHL